MIRTELFDNIYLNDVISMIERSDSTNRTVETWIENDLTAVLAFDEKNLVGIVPLEKREVSIGRGEYLPVLWVTGAHVEPECRSRGIGTTMDESIQELLSPEYQAVFVYRGDETSRAYKWYRRLGYSELLPVLSFRRDVFQHIERNDNVISVIGKEIAHWEDMLYKCFQENNGAYGGFPKRRKDFWSHKLKTHYYKDFYSYSILVLTHDDGVVAYAFLGRTSMKDNVDRIEVLDYSIPEDEAVRDSLLNGIMDFSVSQGLEEVRIQLSVQDPLAVWIRSRGFTHRYRFNIMGKIINPVAYMRDRLQEKTDLENEWTFEIVTPLFGESRIGTGKKMVSLFLDENILNSILLNRCNVLNAAEDGRLVLLDGDTKCLDILSSIFPLCKWRYFQVDYI